MKKLISIIICMLILFGSSCVQNPYKSSKRSVKNRYDYYNMHELDQQRRDKVLIRQMKKN